MNELNKVAINLALIIPITIVTFFSNIASAHFPWVMLNDESKPVLFFGEDLSDRTYHLPKSLSAFPLKHFNESDKSHLIQMHPFESEKLIGLVASESINRTGCVFGTYTYGNFRGSKLVYYVQHFPGDDPQQWQCPPSESGLQAQIQPHDDGIRVTINWNQKPLADAEVRLSASDGDEHGLASTHPDGSVTFTGEQLKQGLNAIMVGYIDKSATGTIDGTPFSSSSNYITATFNWISADDSNSNAANPIANSEVRIVASALPDLPTELTSFGGAIAQGTLYVYGGHIGEAHSYSTAEQSDALYALDLKTAQNWEKLSSGPRLQGLAMVPHHHSIVRLGGFTALNAEGEEHDLRSQRSVAQYDPINESWTELTELPEPRSSHAATKLGDHVYVIGGWEMSGVKDALWHTTAWVANLCDQPITWKEIATPPFSRRALSVAAFQGKIYAIGGMEQKGGPTTRVDVYDPQSNQWSVGPSLEGEPMTGFGCWAEPLGASLYTSTVSGTIQRLSADKQRWEIVGHYQPGRFFHCMLPLDDRQMVMVGGANMKVGRFTNLDLMQVDSIRP
jgi:hypothetical protein